MADLLEDTAELRILRLTTHLFLNKLALPNKKQGEGEHPMLALALLH